MGTASSATFEVNPGESIQTAIDAASNGDTVLVNPGEYLGSGYENISFLGKAIRVRSAAGPGQTVIGGESWDTFEMIDTCFRFENGEGTGSSLEGFTIQHSRRGILCDGGAVLIEDGSSPQFSSTVFASNVAAVGGAVYVDDSQCTFDSVEFRGNNAHSIIHDDGLAEGRGGAIYARNSSLILDDATFTDNVCAHNLPPEPGAGAGGALYLEGSDCIVRGALFTGNRSDGVGIVAYLIADSWLDLESTTIAGNERILGYVDGSAIHVEGSTLLADRTIVSFTGGGVGLFGADPSAGLSLSCSDIYGNEASEYGGTFTDQTGANGNISEDPLFCDLTGQDLALALGSPCLPGGNGCAEFIGYLAVGCDEITAVLAIEAAPVALHRNHPNPFNPSTTIRFSLIKSARVRLTIHDAGGRRVATLAHHLRLGAGEHSLRWDGLDNAGSPAPSGQYYCRLDADGTVKTIKLMLMK